VTVASDNHTPVIHENTESKMKEVKVQERERENWFRQEALRKNWLTFTSTFQVHFIV
jgi:hypothetical protein